MDWFYTFLRILRFKKLEAIDINSVVLLVRKMRINSEKSPAFLPMLEVAVQLNQGTIAEQVIANLQPAMIKKDGKTILTNHKLINPNPIQL